MRKMIIEARINEYARRDMNPHVPWTPAEIAADAKTCVDAGASIIHFHARRPDGSASHDYETYRAIVEAIRETVDVLVHPTLGVDAASSDAPTRLDHIERLVRDGLAPDLAPLDMGSSNVDMIDTTTGRFLSEESIYLNTTRTLRHFAERLSALGVAPYPQIWNIPHLRQLQAFIDQGLVTSPLFVALGLSGGGALATHPGTLAGLRAYLDFLPTGIDFNWSTALFGSDLLPLVPEVAAKGGHISIGIGDHHYAELGAPSNAALIAETVRRVRAEGVEIATVAEAAAMLGRPMPAHNCGIADAD